MIPNNLYIWKLTCRCVFLNKREVLSRFFGKSNIFKYVSTSQTRSYDFWIMNAMCTFVYLFVVYFSFAPVISASIHPYIHTRQLVGLVGRVFANDPGDLGSIPGRVIPKTLKMVLHTSLLNTQQYKVRIKGKVEQSKERSSALPYASV